MGTNVRFLVIEDPAHGFDAQEASWCTGKSMGSGIRHAWIYLLAGTSGALVSTYKMETINSTSEITYCTMYKEPSAGAGTC